MKSHMIFFFPRMNPGWCVCVCLCVCFVKWSRDELNIAESVESWWWGCMLNSPLPQGTLGTPAKRERERENPQRIRLCYKIQLKIISWLDLIFHHIVIVHSNLWSRNLTPHVKVFSPPSAPQDATVLQCKVFTIMVDAHLYHYAQSAQVRL